MGSLKTGQSREIEMYTHKERYKEKERERAVVVVVAQLAERSLSTSEVRRSNPDIGKISIEHCFLLTVLKRPK